MDVAVGLIALAVTVLAGTVVSERLRMPAPLLLIVIGIAASFVPSLPQVQLGPDVVLFGLLPPLLYAAARQTSLVDFRANRRPILLLSVGLVIATTVAVAVALRWVLPDLSWPVAMAIGAVVAPPDAVAATAIARRIGLPRTLVSILEGESLLNDATSLVALRTAIAAMGGGVAAYEVGLDFVRAAGGGALVGFACFAVVAWIRRHLQDPILDTALSLLTPFAAYVAAENHVIHASGVIAVVVAGLLLGHKAPIIQTSRSRLTESITWRTIAFVLENVVFLLIGLQARWILEGVQNSGLAWPLVIAACGVTLATVIIVRLLWLYSSRVALWARTGRAAHSVPWAGATLVGWAGMRGVVTLAAAFVIPTDVEYRDLLLLIAFSVVAGTLLIQGLTLPWLTRRLGVEAPDPAADALARATLLQQAAVAGLDRLDQLEGDDLGGVRDIIRARVEQRTFAAWERLGTTSDREAPSDAYARMRAEMLTVERQRVLEIRDLGQVPAEVVREVLGMLDIEESMLDTAREERAFVTKATTIQFGEECAELAALPAVETSPDPECASCVAEGLSPVALRQCLTCGHIGCCDSSPGRHATGHYESTRHPVMQSAEPDEMWRWCYVHHATG